MDYEQVSLSEKSERIFDVFPALLDGIRSVPYTAELKDIESALEQIGINELGIILREHVRKFEQQGEGSEIESLRERLSKAASHVQSYTQVLADAAAKQSWTDEMISLVDNNWHELCHHIAEIAVIVIKDKGKVRKFLLMSSMKPAAPLSLKQTKRNSRISCKSVPTIEEGNLDDWRDGSWSHEHLERQMSSSLHRTGQSSDRSIGRMLTILTMKGRLSKAEGNARRSKSNTSRPTNLPPPYSDLPRSHITIAEELENSCDGDSNVAPVRDHRAQKNEEGASRVSSPELPKKVLVKRTRPQAVSKNSVDGTSRKIELPVEVNDDGTVTANNADISAIFESISTQAQKGEIKPITILPQRSHRRPGSATSPSTPTSILRLQAGGGVRGGNRDLTPRQQSPSWGSGQPLWGTFPGQPFMGTQMVYQPHKSTIRRFFEFLGDVVDEMIGPDINRCPCGIQHLDWHAVCCHCPYIHPC